MLLLLLQALLLRAGPCLLHSVRPPPLLPLNLLLLLIQRVCVDAELLWWRHVRPTLLLLLLLQLCAEPLQHRWVKLRTITSSTVRWQLQTRGHLSARQAC
jgi:hypothetical protein